MDLATCHHWIATQKEPMLEAIERWCHVSSGSTNLNGLQRMAEVLAADFEPLGLPVNFTPLPTYSTIDDRGEPSEHSTGPMLVWRARTDLPRQVLLMIHYDTVYGPLSQPQSCQRIGPQYLMGPGTADAKGGIAVLRWVAEALARFPIAEKLGWTIVLNPDEEIGSASSWPVLSTWAKNYELALLFEPAMPDGALVSGRKGTGNFSIVMHGRSAHSGRNPQDGRNAVVRLCRLAVEIDKLNAPDRGLTVNVAKVQGGDALNRVPDLAVARVNVRALDAAAMEHFQQGFRNLIAEFQDADYPCSVHGGLHAPPKPMDEPSGVRLRAAFQQSAERCGRNIVWRMSGGASDGNKLASIGVPNIDSLGPTGFDLHSPTERCDMQSLVPAVQSVVQFLHDLSEHSSNVVPTVV